MVEGEFPLQFVLELRQAGLDMGSRHLLRVDLQKELHYRPSRPAR